MLVNEVDEKAQAREQQRSKLEDEARMAEQLRHAETLDALKRGQVHTNSVLCEACSRAASQYSFLCSKHATALVRSSCSIFVMTIHASQYAVDHYCVWSMKYKASTEPACFCSVPCVHPPFDEQLFVCFPSGISVLQTTHLDYTRLELFLVFCLNSQTTTVRRIHKCA